MNIAKIAAVVVTVLFSFSTFNLVLAEDLPPVFGSDNDEGFYSTGTDSGTDSETGSTSAGSNAGDQNSHESSPSPDPTPEPASLVDPEPTPEPDPSQPQTQTRAFEDFSDVPVDHPYYNAIIVLRYQGLLKGYEDNTFRPEQPLNRVEALKLVFEAAEITMNNGVAQAQFSDTEEMAWYSGYLNKAVFLEIVSGYADGTFKPGQSVNLVEFLKMLLLAQNVDLSKVNLNQLPYADVMPGQWYSKYINYAKIHDLLHTGEDNLVYPGEALTRARAADIIYRFRNRSVSDSNSNQQDSATPAPSTSVVPVKDFALFVSASQKFAIQYPKVWFYSAFVEKLDPAALAVYGFGPDDLTANPPLVTLELLPDSEEFATNLYSDGFIYLREEKAATDGAAAAVVLSAKIDGSTRIYRLTGPAEQEANMLTMLKSLTVNIDGLESYNPATPTATEAATEDQSTSDSATEDATEDATESTTEDSAAAESETPAP